MHASFPICTEYYVAHTVGWLTRLSCQNALLLLTFTGDELEKLNNWFPTLLCSQGFPSSSVGKESTCNAGHPGLIPGWGRSPGEGIGYPLLQYSGLENSMDYTVHGGHKESDTTERLSLSLCSWDGWVTQFWPTKGQWESLCFSNKEKMPLVPAPSLPPPSSLELLTMWCLEELSHCEGERPTFFSGW